MVKMRMNLNLKRFIENMRKYQLPYKTLDSTYSYLVERMAK